MIGWFKYLAEFFDRPATICKFICSARVILQFAPSHLLVFKTCCTLPLNKVSLIKTLTFETFKSIGDSCRVALLLLWTMVVQLLLALKLLACPSVSCLCVCVRAVW